MSKNQNKLTVANGRVYSGRGDPLKFVRLIARNYPIGKAKEMSGYSKGYCTKDLMKTANAQQAIYLADEERKRLQQSPGTSIVDSVEFLQTVRDDEEIDYKTRLQANKGINEVLGHNAPTKVEVQEKGLFLHMHGYASDVIGDAIQAQKDRISHDQ